jgi:hypothetical protein
MVMAGTKPKRRQPSAKTLAKRQEVLDWVKTYRKVVTPEWSAYQAAKAGIEWEDWLEARGPARRLIPARNAPNV